MKLEELFLKKEELPILHKTCFQIPIHPKLLSEDLRNYESLAKDIFPYIADDWYSDLKKYVANDKDGKKWIDEVYLDKKPEIKSELHRQFVNDVWEDLIQTADNGLVTCFSINRNAGGSLYFNEEEFNCQSFGKVYIKFSEEKWKEFQFEDEFNKLHVYAPHNIDSYPGALFLRNWAIKYMNEVFKEIF
jgi:hypothetical protein